MATIFSAEHTYSASGWKYKELTSGAVFINGKSISIDMVKVPANTPDGWQAIGSKARDVDCRFYDVTLDSGTDLEAGLKNLQYFFIRADRAMELRRKAAAQNPTGDHEHTEFGMLVHLSRNSDIYKLKTYLAMISQGETEYNLLYMLDTNAVADTEKRCFPITPMPREATVQLGKLFPLLHVVADYNTQLPGDVPLADLLNTAVFDHEGRKIKLENQEITKCFENDSTGEGSWWDSIHHCCEAMLYRTALEMRGSARKIRDKLGDYICSKRSNMTLMAEIQWFFQLQQLAKLKVLSNENGALAESVLEKCRQDAIACAEGLAQILENSCQHSNRKSAYLSLRLHEVSLYETTRNMAKTISSRQQIIKRYLGMWDRGAVDGDKMKWKNEEVLHREARYYFEIDVVDDASIEAPPKVRGILYHYLQHVSNNAVQQARLPEKLIDIFDDLCYVNPDHTVLHYGLQALRQHIQVNSGCFLVSSPREDCTEMVLFRSGKELWQRTIPNKLETTEYHILMPLGLREPEVDLWKDSKSADGLNPSETVDNMLDLSCLKDHQNNKISVYRRKIETLNLAKTPDQKFPDQKYKDDGVKTYANELNQIICAPFDPTNTIYLLDIRELDDIHTEIFSKALFTKIMTNDRRRLLFALFFRNSMQQQITIRMCSVFYRRCRKLHHLVDDIVMQPGAQVALCSHSSLGYPEVNMILNLRDWNSLSETVIRYAYNNLAASHRLYAQIKYFLYGSEPNEELRDSAPVMEVFPFDLYLKDPVQEQTRTENRCWFLQSVHSMLTKELQRDGKDGGIKVNDIHVHLPTNVHVEAFYSADLLFRNVSYVSRFAYLLALRLREDSFFSDYENVLIVCYEAYSSLLMQYLEYYLNQSSTAFGDEREDRVRSAIVYREKKHSARLHLPSDLEQKHDTNPSFFSKWKFIVLSPISTTLSTVHMLHEIISRECTTVTSSNVKDYTIILVGQNSENKRGGTIQRRYWEMRNPESEKGIVDLRDRMGLQTWDVGYLTHVTISWHDPDDCGADENRTLVHADTTSTELKLLFPPKLTSDEDSVLRNANGMLYPNLEDPRHWHILHQHDVCSLISPVGISTAEHKKRIGTNNRRLRLLKGCISYSHIVRSSNHYAYYLEFSQCYERIRSRENRKDWTDWLLSLRKKRRRDVLTILVAPLRLGISPFLKDLIDYVFTESIHVLQLDMHNTRRLDVLTKYRYVAETCKEALKADPCLELHVHYIDDSIVTADTLRRGQSMMDMLLRNVIPADTMASRVKLFSGVYVMLNRSSRDTIQSLVEDPDRDFHAYMHLAVPHFNTHNDYCPSCGQVEKFNLLKKCSATNRLAGEFQRLAEKHTKRTPEEYLQWQTQQLYNSRSSFLRLRQWVLNQNHRPPAGLEQEYEIVCAHLERIKMRTFEDILRKYRDMMEQENRIVRQQNQATLELAAKAGELGCGAIRLRPLLPSFKDVSDLLSALNSSTVYHNAFIEQNPQSRSASFSYGGKIIGYTAVVYTAEAAAEQHERIRQEFLKELGELKLCDCLFRTDIRSGLASTEKTKIAYERIWFNGVLADQAYRRMIAVHEAFSFLLLEKETATVEDMRAMIIDFLLNGSILGERMTKKAPSVPQIIDRWEWLHSIFKVLSRNELVHYHMVRAVMFQILRECAQEMLGTSSASGGNMPYVVELFRMEEGGNIKTLDGTPDDPIDALMRYQLFTGILRRLADMQSNYPIETLGDEKVLNKLQILTMKFFETRFGSGTPEENGKRWFYCTIPSYEKMVSAYEKCIKLSTMAEDDETKSNKIQEHFTKKGIYR